MRFSYAVLFSLPCLATANAILKRDANFESVRTRLQKDMSGKEDDPKEKYFRGFDPHYDGRFAEKKLGYYNQTRDVANLVETYISTFSQMKIETWLMHDTLLGWWWNQNVLPWSADVDVQVSEYSMSFLASYHNMTMHRHRTARIPEGRDYLLEINPHYVEGGIDDELNAIDARWIDTYSGVYIDISTIRQHDEEEETLYCKGGHKYKKNDIYPLRTALFNKKPIKVPFSYVKLLEEEYGEEALSRKKVKNHVFSDEKMEWLLSSS